jgi:hypothetical protein
LNSYACCIECGALLRDGISCWDQFGALLSREADDPELLAEHYLTVATYNLQHPAQFTKGALADLRAAFIEHLDHGLPVTKIRRRMGKAFKGQRPVLRPEGERRPRPRVWSMTISDVYVPETLEGSAARVREWAQQVRDELSSSPGVT